MKPVVIRFSAREKLIYFLCTLLVPVGLILGYNLSTERPDVLDFIFFAVYEVLFLFFLGMSFRFELRANDEELYHRELVTRRLNPEEVVSIKIARKKKAYLVKHVNVEIKTKDARILVGWREKKLLPFVRFLVERYGDMIEEAKELPDV
ncbi:MAG: hypothetical protein ACYS47_09930 [Planctomycetota bacterium]|jgi:hypothetical protein